MKVDGVYVISFCILRQQVVKSAHSEPDDGVIRSFDFLQREGQEEGTEEMDDGGNADDELDDRDVEVNRVSMKRGNQGIYVLLLSPLIVSNFHWQ